jgi:hypothetical protein
MSASHLFCVSGFFTQEVSFPKFCEYVSLILNTDSVHHCRLYFTINSDNLFDSRWRQKISAVSKFSIPALEPNQLSSQWVSGTFSSRVMRPGSEADHSHPSSADVKTGWKYRVLPFKYNQQDATSYNILYYVNALYVSGSFPAHHQELKNCT